MSFKLQTIRLDKLNIPADTLRRTSTPSAKKILETSIENNGLLVPIIVKHMSKGEYEVWDGTRRVTALRNLGKTGNFSVQALVVEGEDQDSIITQININQARERLTNLAEAEGLKVLVEQHKWSQIDAAKVLSKSKSWASRIMKVWSLPNVVLKDVRKGLIPLSHAIVISRYIDDLSILNMLHKESLRGDVARSHLAAMGKSAKTLGVAAAKKERPKRYKFGLKSWLRTEPLQKGQRFEIHLNQEDNIGKIAPDLIKILKNLSKK